MPRILPPLQTPPSSGILTAPPRQFVLPTRVYPPNFELLFSDASWRQTWTHIVPRRFSDSPYTGLLFFEQSTCYAEVYETDGAGRIVAPPLETYSPLGDRTSWTHVIPGLFGESGFTGILLYDQGSGFGRFLECTGDGNLIPRKDYSVWRATWAQIVPGFFTKSRNTSLLFYSPSENYGEIWETNVNCGLSGTAPAQTFSDWRSTWTHIVAADFFWTPGYIYSTPVFSDLFFYEGSTGYAEMYRFDIDPSVNDGRLVPYPTASRYLMASATNVAAGNFGGSGYSDVLLHDRENGILSVYSFLDISHDDVYQAQLFLLETLSGLRTTFDLVVTGKFFMADPDDHWFNDGPGGAMYFGNDEQRNWRAGTGAFSDLLLYDSAAGLGETYLHEPIPPPVPALDAYLTSESSHSGAPPVASGSVLPGDNLSFHVSSRSPYTLKIYRLGSFDGGATEQLMTEIGNVLPATGLLPISRTGYLDGAGWPAAITIEVSNYPTGLYVARVEDTESPPNLVNVPFVVRAPSGFGSKILLVIADATYAVYNDWGGRNAYGYATADSSGSTPAFVGTFPSSSAARAPYALQVSFERPFAYTLGNSVYADEVPMIQWLMQQGIAFDVCTERDLHFEGSVFSEYRLLLFVGHHEYWTWEMRDHVESFVKAGGNVAFLCANTCWWQIRISPDGKQASCYKVAGFDPAVLGAPELAAINWYQLGRPETTMTGASYYGSGISLPDGIPYVLKKPDHWAFEGTGLIEGDWFGLFCGQDIHSIIGWECDRIQPADAQVTMRSPANYTIASARDPRDGNETATMGSFLLGKGEVFNGATINWTRALVFPNEPWNKIPQITLNVINRLGGG
jgi:hypothetical protein